MFFSTEQIDKLSNLFLDLAKGLFLSAIAIPVLSPQLTFFISLKGIITGLVFTYLSLKILESKEALS